ncbi:MAG: SPW repeat protein [Patescibacteria group bacterium]
MSRQWLEAVLGLWLMLSPWVLGFSGISVMMWSNLIAGMAVFLIALWSIFGAPTENKHQS